MLTRAQQQQVQEQMPAAKNLALRFSRNDNSTREELESEGYLGLCIAVQKHSEQDGPLDGYCRGVMFYYMLRWLSKEAKHRRRERQCGGMSWKEAPHTLNPENMVDVGCLLRRLTKRQKRVLSLYYGVEGNMPLTLQKIGQELKLTAQRVHQILHSAIRTLNRKGDYHGGEQNHGRSVQGQAGHLQGQTGRGT